MAGETWYSYSGYNKERIDVDNTRIEISKAGDFVSDGTIKTSTISTTTSTIIQKTVNGYTRKVLFYYNHNQSGEKWHYQTSASIGGQSGDFAPTGTLEGNFSKVERALFLRIISWVNAPSEARITTKAGLLVSPEPFYPFVKINNYVVNWGYYEAFKLFEYWNRNVNENTAKLMNKCFDNKVYNALVDVLNWALSNLFPILAEKEALTVAAEMLLSGLWIPGLAVLGASIISIAIPSVISLDWLNVGERIKNTFGTERTILAVKESLTKFSQNKFFYLMPMENNDQKVNSTLALRNIQKARDKAWNWQHSMINTQPIHRTLSH
ncbi:hypothetical protein FACS1894208_01780 [Clostridia bacterium]|nr:hypothetical protein FACS1894208_01780 [Clostridia bacterium]